MGLIRAALGAAGGVMADQWKEYFYCESIPENVMAVKGLHRISGRSSNYKGSENIISNGSVIAVADGQCMIIVDQGKVTELCAEPGEFVYDCFDGTVHFLRPARHKHPRHVQEHRQALHLRRRTSERPARLLLQHEGTDRQQVWHTHARCRSASSTREPASTSTLPSAASANTATASATRSCSIRTSAATWREDYTSDRLDGQLKTELLTALQPAFAKISDMGIRYSALPGHTMELADALNEVLSGKWRNLRGLEIVSFGVSSVKASEEDEQMLKEMQRNAAFMDPTRAAAHLVGAQAAAMQSAASNQGAGPAMAFMGMNMAGQMGGMNAQNLYQMGAQQQAAAGGAAQPAAPAARTDGWTCKCGKTGNTGKFCAECGSPKPADDSWTCSCGAVNHGKFCAECGKPKPTGPAKCAGCGWEAPEGQHPKFCPECGKPFA